MAKAPAKPAAKPKKLTAAQQAAANRFATNQLLKAGIKPVKGGDVTAQFRAANKVAVKKRTAAGLDKANRAGADSALAAGMRGPKRTAVVVKPPPKKKKKP